MTKPLHQSCSMDAFCALPDGHKGQHSAYLHPGYTVVLHVSVDGSYERAEAVAEALERAAKRAGGRDTMLEVLEAGV